MTGRRARSWPSKVSGAGWLTSASWLCDVPDPINAVSGHIAGLLVLHPVIERHSLLCPLLAAILALDQRICAGSLRPLHCLEGRPVLRTGIIAAGFALAILVESIKRHVLGACQDLSLRAFHRLDGWRCDSSGRRDCCNCQYGHKTKRFHDLPHRVPIATCDMEVRQSATAIYSRRRRFFSVPCFAGPHTALISRQ